MQATRYSSGMAKQSEGVWQAHIKYNQAGQEIERLLPGGLSCEWKYDQAGSPGEHKVIRKGVVQSWKKYRWNTNDRLTNIFDALSQANTHYKHDTLGNLVFAQYADNSILNRVADDSMGFSNVNDYFGIFGKSADGSMYSLWRDDAHNTYKIVHMGSEGNQLFVLAHNFVDFLRLVAIGYDEIGFCDLSKLPEENEGYDADTVNPRFAELVRTSFNVTIPRTGDELVNIYDKSFDNWVADQIDKHS